MYRTSKDGEVMLKNLRLSCRINTRDNEVSCNNNADGFWLMPVVMTMK